MADEINSTPEERENIMRENETDPFNRDPDDWLWNVFAGVMLCLAAWLASGCAIEKLYVDLENLRTAGMEKPGVVHDASKIP